MSYDVYDVVYNVLEASIGDVPDEESTYLDAIMETCDTLAHQFPELVAHLEPYRQHFQYDNPEEPVSVRLTNIGIFASHPE